MVRNYLIIGVACAAALVPMAFFYPVEGIQNVYVKSGASYVTPKFSLVRVHGLDALRFVALPLSLSMRISWLSVKRVRAGSRASGWFSWAFTGLMALGAMAGTATFLIGIYVCPYALFLRLANLEVARAPRSAAP